MRETKYRAWYKKAKSLLQVRGIQFYDDSMRINIYGLQYSDDEYEPADKFELMQYTGLQDKNGKEIYEGDIIRFQDIEMEDDPVTGYIDFRDGTFIVRQEGGSVYRFWNDGMHDWHTVEYLDCETCEVLGNIHENPELLK